MNNLEQLKILQPKLWHKALIIKTQGKSFEFWINLSSGSVRWCKAGTDDPILFLDQFQLPQEVLGSVEERLNTNQVPNTEAATSCDILLTHRGHCPHIIIVCLQLLTVNAPFLISSSRPSLPLNMILCPLKQENINLWGQTCWSFWFCCWTLLTSFVCWKCQFCNVWVWFGHHFPMWQIITSTKSRIPLKQYWRDYVMMKLNIVCWLSWSTQLSYRTQCFGPLCL